MAINISFITVSPFKTRLCNDMQNWFYPKLDLCKWQSDNRTLEVLIPDPATYRHSIHGSRSI